MNRRAGDVPKWVEISMIFIERIGFPTVAFLLIYYICYVSINKMTETLESISAEMITQRKVIEWNNQDLKEQILRLDIPRRR